MADSIGMIIERETGNDTEQARLNFGKYVRYGMDLAKEQNLPPDLTPFLKEHAGKVIAEISDLHSKLSFEQNSVEKVDEDEAFAALALKYADPQFADILVDMQTLLNTVDAKHIEIIKRVRDAGMEEILAKYVGLPPQEEA